MILKNNAQQKSRSLAPDVRAGRELMARLGGIAILGTQQRPYYHFPAAKRTDGGVDKCQRCVRTCGDNAACNVQPLVRVAPNVYESSPCHNCVLYPPVFDEDRCSLDGKRYIFDGDNNRLLSLDAKGEPILSEAEQDSVVPGMLGTPLNTPASAYSSMSDDSPLSSPGVSANPLPIITEIAHGLITPSDSPLRTPADRFVELPEVETHGKSSEQRKELSDEIEHLRSLLNQTEDRWERQYVADPRV